ncbi:MAG: Hsp20/alpha crystallin family protein [Candidatus Nanohaloarchaea archaeon]
MRRLRRHDEKDVLSQMQRMFEEMQEMGKNLVGFEMPVDIREEDTEIIITADLPGVEKEEIGLKVDKEGVEITAEGSAEVKEENEKYIRRERSERKFRRKINWPKKVNPDTAEASYKDGVLEIRTEKDESEGRDIEIN